MTLKILVVDDNEVTGKFLTTLLTEKGYQVEILKEGSGIVDAVNNFNPHLIIMDIMLPDMDGAEAVRLLHEDPRTSDIPVIFLSAILEKDDLTNNTISVDDKVYPALSKSSTTNDLINAIRKVIKK